MRRNVFGVAALLVVVGAFAPLAARRSFPIHTLRALRIIASPAWLTTMATIGQLNPPPPQADTEP